MMNNKKRVLGIALVLVVLLLPVFGAEDSSFLRINTYIEENVGNTGIRITTTELDPNDSLSFDTLFFNSVSDLTMTESEDVSTTTQSGTFYVLARRVVNNDIEIKVTGTELSMNGDSTATIPYSVERITTEYDNSFNTGTATPSYEMTYTASPVGGIVRSYEDFVYNIPQASGASSGSYSATITFEIMTT